MKTKDFRFICSASVIVFVLIACAFLFSACGGSSGTNQNDQIAPQQSLGDISPQENLIYTDAYAGYLVVFMDGATWDSSAAPQNDIQVLQGVVSKYPSATLKRSVPDMTPDELDALKQRLENESGKPLTDFNFIYHIETSKPDEAVLIMRELNTTAGVDKVYPKTKAILTSLATVPDLTGVQGYIEPNETHGGLNARAAWAEGARGSGIILVDAQYSWNYDHEDLPLDYPDDRWGGIFPYECYPTIRTSCIPYHAHGTAVAGIVAALDNGHGTTGFAPEVDYKTGFDDISIDFLDPERLPPGSVYLLEVSLPGRLTDPGAGDQYGTVPYETDPERYATVEYAIAAGVSVIEPAANGSISLDDDSVYWPTDVRLYSHDSGSILVGASQGSNHRKASFSNCGSPVRAYAWGQGIVTTSYPYSGIAAYGWTTIPGGPNPPNDDNNAYFTNQFGGTSASTPMVAGAAILLQNYAKNLMGHSNTRYITPAKIRELLTSTGVAQADGGCNIGRQPRLDQAITAIDTLWTNATRLYPELTTSGRITGDDQRALRASGIGLICYVDHPDLSDPVCPDEDMWPTGVRIAKTLDFDGDNRADLVSWTNGQWRVDLSSVGSGGDNYGTWDLILNYTPIDGRWVWPMVEDYNSDGREDFAVYDKQHGKWYITFTTSELLASSTWPGWDWEIDYSAEWVDTLEMDPWNSQYSRPVAGDYDGDGWVDIAIACSDGYWRIDFGGANRSNYGTFDQNIRYLSDEQLRQAPGWAYPVATGRYALSRFSNIVYKVPDGLGDEGRIAIYFADEVSTDYAEVWGFRPIFGGNNSIMFDFDYDTGTGNSIKTSETWKISRDGIILDPIPPQDVWGGLNCRPVISDFDRDGISDRAVMCPNEWRIAYSSDTFAKSDDGTRHVPFTYNANVFTLPGRSYSGGISYTLVQQLIAYAQEINPTVPPPIPVDMATVSVCQLTGSGECH